MTQYNTFFVPNADSGEAQERMNAFLRGHRVLNVEKHAFRSGWGFCVEWMDGVASHPDIGNWRKSPRIDYRDFLQNSWQISELEYQCKVTALTVFLMQFDTSGYRRRYFGCRREASGSNRVMRGGSYNNDAGNCTSSNCNNNNPSNNNDNNGFRLVCSAAPQVRSAAPVGIQLPEIVADSFAYIH